MYKLSYFRATNVRGFMSGCSRKTVTIDLHSDGGTDFLNKEMIVIIGGNAKGKSTFLSLIHPLHTPSDDRKQFIVPGKEGSLIRTYEGDDGTIITSKCIYKPKPNGEGHNPSCFLAVKRPGDDEEVEMNPSGNVTSYMSLLYTYFGLSKEYVNFASYSDSVSNIVEMTGSQRKSSAATIIPNTKRFELAYNAVNEKYRNLRNMSRNVAQKLLSYRDEDSLISDLKRIEKELSQADSDRDEYTRKLAKAEGRVKELSHGEDLHSVISSYNELVKTLEVSDHEMDKIRKRLFELYDDIGIEHDENSINFNGIDEVFDRIQKYERKAAFCESNISSFNDQIKSLKNKLSELDNEIMENESVLCGLELTDISELEETREGYIETLNGLTYTKHKDDYADLSYDEIIQFSKAIANMDNMIQSLYDEYGELVSIRYKNLVENKSNDSAYNVGTLETLNASLLTNNKRRDEIYRKLIEKKQYSKFQDILDQRPVTCHDDNCPFIKNALKWKDISRELAGLEEEYAKLSVSIDSDQKRINDIEKWSLLASHSNSLEILINSYEHLFKKYLHVTVVDIYTAISNGTWSSVFDMVKIKSIASVLSEKDLYNRIVTQLLPEVEHSIELAKVYGTNRDLIISQINKLKDNRKDIKQSISELNDRYKVSVKMIKHYSKLADTYKLINNKLQEYQDIAVKKIKAGETIASRREEIKTIEELVDKCRDYQAKLNSAKDLIKELTPIRQQIIMDRATVNALQEEKLQIERDYNIVDIMHYILQPGKGINKELIDIYMYDIYQLANDMLINTFNGQLYLTTPIISDTEFIMPFVYNGSEGSDISVASSSQKSAIAMAFSLAIISKLIDKYGVLTIDEADKAFSESNKANFADIICKDIKLIGVSQTFVITHNPEYYVSSGNDIGFICFPEGKVSPGSDVIYID